MVKLRRDVEKISPNKIRAPLYHRWKPIVHNAIICPQKKTKAMYIFDSKEIKNKHKGEDIFVLGNGPSVKDVLEYGDYFKKANCISIYVAYWLLHCNYVLFSDIVKLGAEVYEELLSLDSYVFAKDYSMKKYKDFPRYFNKIRSTSVSGTGILANEIDEHLYNGGGSVFLAINLAYILGAKNIIMLGIDMDSGEHFYDNMKQFHNRSFYKFVKSARSPNIKRYKGDKRVIKNMKKVERFLNSKGVNLINCSKRSVVGGEYRPLVSVLNIK